MAGPGDVALNSLSNAVGVGIDGQRPGIQVSASVLGLPAATGSAEKVGTYLGYSQDNVLTFYAESLPGNVWRIKVKLEFGGVVTVDRTTSITYLPGTPLTFSLLLDASSTTVTPSYRLGSDPVVTLPVVVTPGEFFTFDAAGLDPELGTRSFGGVFATSGTAPSLATSFSQFSVIETAPPVATSFEFNKTSSTTGIYALTALTFGPDGKMYATDVQGGIHRITLGADKKIISNERFNALGGSRMALGIGVDPDSTPGNITLWINHSSPVTDGQANSGMVTRLTGASFQNRTDVITGIPRSQANHGPNALHFGPDGKIYISVGGITGSGAANTAASEFGDWAEQKLSGALLVADVDAANFDGTCTPITWTADAPCDVTTFATGLRNTYDFTFHRNGKIYGTDNGLGVVGTFPASPTPPCTAFANPARIKDGGQNPGKQVDELNLIEAGGYYGHPNPSRNECVFKDGTLQNVPAPANYHPPMFVTGSSKSSDGIIEYTNSTAFCGALDGKLLYANYSVGDDIIAATLSADGRTVTSTTPVFTGLADPLPLTQQADGTIWVEEFGPNLLTALVPKPSSCWSSGAPMPQGVLDSGGAAVGDSLYVIAGKSGATYTNSVKRYSATTQAWSTVAAKPGTPLENPAVAVIGTKIYVMGGATDAFSGALDEAYVYDTTTDTWSPLTGLPTARGGAGAAVVGGKIYVVGGMNSSGSSLSTVEIYDPATDSWTTGPSLAVPRDNPMVAAVGTEVVAIGGRTRSASPAPANGTLASVEILGSGASAWAAGPAMPTGRRTAATGVVNGKIIVAGGEGNNAAPGTFSATEAFDVATRTWTVLGPIPTPRHGTSAGVINGKFYVAGGAAASGASASSALEILAP